MWLGSFPFPRIQRDGHDRRFMPLHRNPVLFSSEWTLQALWVFLLLLLVLIINAHEAQPPIGPGDIVGWTVWGWGLAVETVTHAEGGIQCRRRKPPPLHYDRPVAVLLPKLFLGDSGLVWGAGAVPGGGSQDGWVGLPGFPLIFGKVQLPPSPPGGAVSFLGRVGGLLRLVDRQRR